VHTIYGKYFFRFLTQTQTHLEPRSIMLISIQSLDSTLLGQSDKHYLLCFFASQSPPLQL